ATWVKTVALLFLSTVVIIAIPYTQLRLQPSGIGNVPPAILLTIIAPLTCAAGGGTICNATPIGPCLQVPLVIVAYLLVGAGLSLGLAYDAVILFQHFSDFYPLVEKVWQDMILCGPFGQGGFALQILGAVVKKSFAAYGRGTLLTNQAAIPISVLSQFSGILAWGSGTFWWCFAIISIIHTLVGQPGGIKKTTFSTGAWSLVFPWGVYTNCAVELGKILDSPAFAVWSTALLLMLVIIAITLTLFTIKGVITGKIFSLEHGWRERAYHDDKTA
ncbi:Sulfite efflux pump SSU1, partial [Talaromyces pinophilus]